MAEKAIMHNFKHEPEDVAILHDCGLAAYYRRDFERARKIWKALTRIRPEFAEAHAGLGSALYGLKRYDEAIASYKEAVGRCNTEKCANLHLGELLALHKEDRENGLLFLRKVKALDPDGQWGQRAQELIQRLDN